MDECKPLPGTKRWHLKYDYMLSSFAFKCDLRRYTMAIDTAADPPVMYLGWAVQVDPIKPTLEVPGTTALETEI